MASKPRCRCSARWCVSPRSSTATTTSIGSSSIWPASKAAADAYPTPQKVPGHWNQSRWRAFWRVGGVLPPGVIRIPARQEPAPGANRRRAMWQILLLTAGFLVLVAISAASVLFVNKARDDSGWVVHTVEVENQTNALLLEVRRAESAARGYLLTSGPDFLRDHEDAVAQIIPDLDKLSHMVGDNPAQRENLRKMRAAIDTRLGQFAQEMQLVKESELAKATDLVRETAAGDTTTTIRNVGDAMRDEETRLLALRTANADRSQEMASTVTIAGSGLVIALAGISIFLVRRESKARDRAESRLRDSNINLEATVDERTADLREANEEIQRFAYIVSHDLRSPLVNIMGFTSELEELRSSIFRRIAALGHATVAVEAPVVAVDAEPALKGEDRQLSE